MEQSWTWVSNFLTRSPKINMKLWTRPILTHCSAIFKYGLPNIEYQKYGNIRSHKNTNYNRIHTSFHAVTIFPLYMHPIFVLTAIVSNLYQSNQWLIKWRTKYVHLRQVHNQKFLTLDSTQPDTFKNEKFCDTTRPDPCRTLEWNTNMKS